MMPRTILERSFHLVKRGSMPGKPAFDEGTVIREAVNTFWTRGYSGTSVANIVEATGLSRSSLYQRFGDKDGLFAEALNAYHALVLRKSEDAAARAASDPIGTILQDFEDGADSRPPGCFVARSIAELAVLPNDLQKLARKCLHEQHVFFASVIRGMVRGDTAYSAADIGGSAWYCVGVFHAVLNLGQGEASRKDLAQVIDLAAGALRRSASTKKRSG